LFSFTDKYDTLFWVSLVLTNTIRRKRIDRGGRLQIKYIIRVDLMCVDELLLYVMKRCESSLDRLTTECSTDPSSSFMYY